MDEIWEAFSLLSEFEAKHGFSKPSKSEAPLATQCLGGIKALVASDKHNLLECQNVAVYNFIYSNHQNVDKVEKTLKSSLDLISSPSPSVKIQIKGGKVCSRCKGKTLSTNFLYSKVC